MAASSCARGGLTCQVDSGNERDLRLPISFESYFVLNFLERLLKRSQIVEARGYSRSVMPQDDLGCTRVTMLWISRYCYARVYD